MTKILVAGVGNVLRGDDGFGLALLERLRSGRFADEPSVAFWESGIAGVSLAQELMRGFDVLVVLDALDRGGFPGQIFVLELDLDRVRGMARRGAAVDLHEAGPEGVLTLAAAAGVLPREVFLVGSQVVSVDDLGSGLSPAVAGALEDAARRVEAILAARVGAVALTDEILQILFWLRGEGLAEDASAPELERWLSVSEDSIEPALHRMSGLDLVVETSPGRFRLTEEGAREGGRRFRDEFSDMTKPGHGECGDPECDCARTGDPADCRHNLA